MCFYLYIYYIIVKEKDFAFIITVEKQFPLCPTDYIWTLIGNIFHVREP